MDPKKNGAPPSTYSEQFFSSGGSTSPREEAEAETERLKTRSETPAGRMMFMEEQLDREFERMERQRAQRQAEVDAHVQQLKQLTEQWQKERQAQLEHMNQVLKVVDQAVVSGWENMLRARQLGELANKEPPPPRKSNAEAFVEVAKDLFEHGESLLTKILERDPEIAQRLASMVSKPLGIPQATEAGSPVAPEPQPQQEATAATAPEPPSPASQQVRLGDIVAAYEILSKEKIAQLAEELGMAPELLPVEVVVRAAAQHASEKQGQAA